MRFNKLCILKFIVAVESKRFYGDNQEVVNIKWKIIVSALTMEVNYYPEALLIKRWGKYSVTHKCCSWSNTL